jgi:hypothetical protein
MADIIELEALLTTPTEALNVEYKSWLDLRGDDEHKAILAKAAIAIANEGGGHIVIGLREQRPNLVSDARPAAIAPYDQDAINQIICRFAAPAFQCTLTTLPHPATGNEHAVVSIPGGFGFPVMSRSGTPANTIRPHLCYMRKPGPESAPPENPGDWERLLSRCLRNRREDCWTRLDRLLKERLKGQSHQPSARQTNRQPTPMLHGHDGWHAWSLFLQSLRRDAPSGDLSLTMHYWAILKSLTSEPYWKVCVARSKLEAGQNSWLCSVKNLRPYRLMIRSNAGSAHQLATVCSTILLMRIFGELRPKAGCSCFVAT